MNHTYYNAFIAYAKHAFVLLAVWLVAMIAVAQDGTFTVKHTVVAGTCEANPTITVEIENSTFPAGTQYQYTLYKYPIYSTDGTPVLTEDQSYTFTHLTEGTYRVEVLVRRDYGSTFKQVVDDITVPVVYEPIVIGTSQGSTQKHSFNRSYSCGTGRMVFEIKGGKPPYTLSIYEGPMHAGETIGYTIEGTTDNGFTLYRLEGENWKPGGYVLHVKDACGNVQPYHFDIEELNEMPYVNTSLSDGTGITLSKSDCNSFKVNLRYGSSVYYTLKREVYAGFYEVGIQPPWMSESDIQWQTMTSPYRETFTFTSADDYYTLFERYGNSFNCKIYIRVKNCPEKLYTTTLTYTFNDTYALAVNTYSGDMCAGDKVLYGYFNAKNPLCYPLSVTINQVRDGAKEPLGTATVAERGESGGSTVVMAAMPEDFWTGKLINLSMDITDAHGHARTANATAQLYTPHVYLPDVAADCGYSHAKLQISNQFRLQETRGGSTYDFRCNIVATLYNAAGEVVNSATKSVWSGTYFFDINYDEEYTLEFYYASHPEKKYTQRIFKQRPVEYITNSINVQAQIDRDRINHAYITATIYYKYGAGSTLTMTDPTGKQYTHTFTAAGNLSYGESNTVYPMGNYYQNIPLGKYTFDLYNTCSGKHTTAELIYKGGYTVDDFTYTLDYLCGEAYLTPSAVVRLQGNVLSKYNYVFFVRKKGNFAEEKKAYSGERIKLSVEGEYQLGVSVKTDYAYDYYNDGFTKPDSIDYRLADITVEYHTPPLRLDPERTFTYACGADELGQIYLQAKGGIAPYTYELYTDTISWTPATAADGTPIKTTDNVYAHFAYGHVGDLVYAKVIDKCGAYYVQGIEIMDVTRVSAVYAQPTEVCAGSPINLRFRAPETLKAQIQAHWYTPKGELLSNTSNNEIHIPNATAGMSGEYRVSFILPGCGKWVENRVNITVGEPLNTTLAKDTYNVCIGAPLTIQGLDAGTDAATATYQWELADQRSTDILALLSGEPEAYVYKWVSHRLLDNPRTKDYSTRFVTAGTYILRQLVSKTGCTAESAPISVHVRACTVPLNPHLMHRPMVNWNAFNRTPTKIIP